MLVILVNMSVILVNFYHFSSSSLIMLHSNRKFDEICCCNPNLGNFWTRLTNIVPMAVVLEIVHWRFFECYAIFKCTFYLLTYVLTY